MLRELRIQNLAVVEDAVIEFDGGLNVLTGSTGAGKSIILTAVELLSGSRGKRSLIRRGASGLSVEGIFTVTPAWSMREDLGMDSGDDHAVIKRELSSEGKSRIWINGMLSSNAAAQRVALSLLELHGQHRQQELLDRSTHIHYLDARGDYRDVLERCAGMIDRFDDLRGRLRDMRNRLEENRRQEDFFRFQLRELEDLKLERDLDKTLETRINRLQNMHRYVSALEESRALLGEVDGSVLERLGKAERALESIRSLDESWERVTSEIEGFRISIQEVIREIERALGESRGAPGDIESLQDRLAAVQRAARKHGLDCSGLIEKRDDLKRILKSLADGSDDITDTERMLDEVKSRLVPLLEELSLRRRNNARILDKEVTDELKKLGMKGALFQTQMERLEGSADGEVDSINLSPHGWDRVEFRIRTNVGEEIHPLSDVASGGELSRITLVLKKLQVKERGISTLIFDEIDSGLGADLGGVVAERLADLSGRYQIICITHLPQIAARAAQHIVVNKKVRGGRTVTTASVLSGERRIEEISRMLGGDGELREKLAAELIKTGQGARSSVG